MLYEPVICNLQMSKTLKERDCNLTQVGHIKFTVYTHMCLNCTVVSGVPTCSLSWES